MSRREKKLSEHRLKPVFDQQNRLLQHEMKKLEKYHEQLSKRWDVKQRQFTLNTLSRNAKMTSVLEEKFLLQDEEALSNTKNKSMRMMQNERRKSIAVTCPHSRITHQEENTNRRVRSQSVPAMSNGKLESLDLLHTTSNSIQPFTRNLGTPNGVKTRRTSLKPVVSKLADVQEEP